MGKSSAKEESSTKSDRKFEKKLQFYSKVRDTVASLAAKRTITKKKKLRSRQKKLKAYDLSTLSDSLPELKASRHPIPAADSKLNCKSRQKLILKEGKQLSTVLNHPAFQVDPLAAINQHIESTQPVSDEKPRKKMNRNGSKKRRGKSKTSDRAQSMDT